MHLQSDWDEAKCYTVFFAKFILPLVPFTLLLAVIGVFIYLHEEISQKDS